MNIGEKFYCSKCMRELEEESLCPYCGHDPGAPVGRSTLEEGTLLQKGRYQLGAVLGAGGFGITYAAWDHVLEQPVAVKEYFPRSLCVRDIWENYAVFTTEENKKAFTVGLLRFSREARILGTLQNIRNVVTVRDWFEDNETAYIVMEFVRGKTIDTYVSENGISPEVLIEMLRDLVDALVLIHSQGILHRDISPGNLLVQEDGTVVLIDFGAAVVEERRALGKDQTVVFNRKFAPVEQYDEKGKQGPWTDVYALSATLYYLISGELPQEALLRKSADSLKSLRARGIKLKKWQEKAIMDGLTVSPEKRIQSMEIFRSLLYHLPMPEEVKRRRAFTIRVTAAASAFVIASLLFAANATVGLPLYKGIRFGMRSDGLHITGYSAKAETLDIPSDILGIPVTQIDEGAFGGAKKLREVSIPGSVECVASRAFSGCESLFQVYVGEGNHSIEEYAFSECPSLCSITLPESTQLVAENAFRGDEEKLTVWCAEGGAAREALSQAGVNLADPSAYEIAEKEDCAAITGYYAPETGNGETAILRVPDYIGGKAVTSFETEDTSPMFSDTLSGIILPEYLESLPMGVINNLTTIQQVELGSSLKEIGDYALFFVGADELVLPDTLEKIGKSAFSQSFVERITLPDSVTQVGESAFAACVSLEEITLSAGMKEVPDGMFEGCTALERVTLPENLESIGRMAFSRCSAMETLYIPLTLTSIGSYAFSECVNLQIVYIPASATDIADTAFDGCKADMVIAGISGSAAESYAASHGFAFLAMDQWDFDSYRVTDNNGLIVWEDAPEVSVAELPSVYAGTESRIIDRLDDARELKGATVIFPEFLETVWASAFAKNTYLKEVYLNESLQQLGSMTFWKCENLHTVHFEEGIRKIGSFAFAQDGSLTQAVLPDSVTDLGMNAFWQCGGLTELHIPASLTVLNDGCFSETGITGVTVPGNVVKCRSSFYGCKNLESAVLEEGVKTLWGTFAQCPALETVVIPSTMEQISRSTFHGCVSLKDVWIYSENVNLDYVWPAVYHVSEIDVQEGELISTKESLESTYDETPLLFADCPDVTIHGYPGSTAEAYAAEHGINFERIQ